MQVSNWIIFGAAELLALLLLVCGFLLIHTRSLKKLVSRLQDRLQTVAQDLKKTKQAYKEMEDSIPEASSYVDLLDNQLETNRDYHQSLEPDQDITLDLSPKTPLPRQLASLRHAFLITEKEAALSSETDNQPNWAVIQAKLGNLMNFFKGAGTGEESGGEDVQALQQALEDSQQRIENLEKFKTLFFELEDKWQAAQSDASQYHQQLTQMADGHPDADTFNQLLQGYQNTYTSFENHLQSGINPGGGVTHAQEVGTERPAASEELDRLKSVAASQHQLISELQHRLEIAYSTADKEAVIEDLKTQLDQQLRYMQESETCIKLLESELDDAHDQISRLEAQANSPQIPPDLMEKLNILKDERVMMHKTIQNLQQENEQLVLQMQASLTEPGQGGANEELVQELKQLQHQYTELESKYLALRMKA